VLLILGAHEFGHYFYCRVYKVDATLPYFLPAPILSGTLGAVIRIKEMFPTRTALFDIGIGGPIAGFVVLVPFLLMGVWMSVLGRVDPTTETLYFGEPLVMKAAIYLRFGVRPEGYDVMLHPMGFAAWWGLLATALNLLPYGQLDGGHIAYAVLGRHAKWVSIVTLGVVWVLVLMSWSWLVTAVLLSIMTAVFGFRHPTPIDDHTPVSRGRVTLAIVAAIIFIISFTPVPVDLIGPAGR
jgi:membrane-associated protease RseP (regulator of RpoE activity)